MAIQKSYTDEASGATYPNAYWRIAGVTIRAQTADIHVQVYVDAAAAVTRQSVDNRLFRVGPAAYDTVWTPTSQFQALTTRAYAYLRALPELAGGQDV